jgi:hypothetical protein
MKRIMSDRRLFAAIFAILCLTFLGYTRSAEVAAAISTIALAVCAANATERIMRKGSGE